jgi:hypothetical protein
MGIVIVHTEDAKVWVYHYSRKFYQPEIERILTKEFKTWRRWEKMMAENSFHHFSRLSFCDVSETLI